MTDYIWGTGRRKSSVARVRLSEGSGKIIINKKQLKEYFVVPAQQEAVMAALNATGAVGRYDLLINVQGGGTTGQSGAILMGISRALCKHDEAHEAKLRSYSYLTRDSRMKERKKYGQKGARASFQFSKR